MSGHQLGTPGTKNSLHPSVFSIDVVVNVACEQVFMGRTYAGAQEDMSDVVGAAASSSSSAAGAVYEGEGYHRPPAGTPHPGEGDARKCIFEGSCSMNCPKM